MNNFNGPQPMFPQQAPNFGGFQNSQPYVPQPTPMNWGQNGPRYAAPSTLPGRQISSIDEIMPNDVPMDGSVSFFPVRDGSCVYAKFWNRQGTIDTIKFVPAVATSAENIENTQPDFAQEIIRRLDKIEKSLNPNGNRKSTSNTQPSPKNKEVSNNE